MLTLILLTPSEIAFLIMSAGMPGAAVKDERHRRVQLLDFAEHLEVEALPVFRILAVDVADARRQHRHAEVGDALALGGVRDLAAAHDAVSSPPIAPTSHSTEMPLEAASAMISLLFSMFSSIG